MRINRSLQRNCLYEDNQQLFTEVEVNSGKYLPRREASGAGAKYRPLFTVIEINNFKAVDSQHQIVFSSET